MLLLLVPLALALIVLSVLGLAGLGPLSDERRADRAGLLAGVGPAVGLLGGVGLIAVALLTSLGLVGMDPGDGPDDAEPGASSKSGERASAPAPTTMARTPPSTAAPAPVDRATGPDGATRRPARAGLGPVVTLDATDRSSFPTSYDVVDGLGPVTVVRVHARGFDPFARAVAEQCRSSADSGRCDNAIPVQFDEDGAARFQYLISADPTVGGRRDRCGSGGPRCTIVVRAVPGGGRAEVQTVFGAEIPPPGRISVTPAAGLSLDGQRVTVGVRGYPPGVTVTAMLCAAPDATGPRCGAPGPTAPLRVGVDGSGTADLVVRPGPVGREHAPCSRGDDCGISVASDTVFARAAVVPVTFAAPPGAAYDPSRLALWLAVAVVLAAIAAWLILRSDWSAVGEAAAPEIDDAEYADLDALVAAMPPEPDELATSR